MGLNHPRYSLFVKKDWALRWGARFFFVRSRSRDSERWCWARTAQRITRIFGCVIGRVFKIEISKVSGSILAAEICTGSHNRLLRRQHCSSLCSQSEGHEHVANMTSALGHNFVEFSDRAWPPQYSPPSLCEQSELQCFASDLRQMPARCPLQRCRNRHAIWPKTAHRFFCILNTLCDWAKNYEFYCWPRTA